MARTAYVEIDPFACAWLRELIKAGCISDGEVMEVSLEDIRPCDLERFTRVHLCAGIAVWDYALNEAGWGDRPVWTMSLPCQPFSQAGQGKGFADDRHLWPATSWLVEQCRPRIILGEQVSAKDGLTWFDLVSTHLEAAGYAVGAVDLCAAGLGAPHIRQRNYWMAHSLSAGRSQRRSGARIGSITGGGAGPVVDAQGQQTGLSGRSRLARGSGVVADDTEPGRIARRRLSEESDGLYAPRLEPGRLRSDSLLGDDDDDDDDDDDEGLAQRPFAVEQPGALRIEGSALGETGLVRGRWAGADWIFCRDGKWRPVEPVHVKMVARAAGGVGYLRGKGDPTQEAKEVSHEPSVQALRNDPTSEGVGERQRGVTEGLRRTILLRSEVQRGLQAQQKPAPVETVQVLRQGFIPEAVGCVGRSLDGVQTQVVLRSSVHGEGIRREDSSSDSAERTPSRTKTSPSVLRALWGAGAARPPQGRESFEQRGVELDDLVLCLPRMAALAQLRSDHGTAQELRTLWCAIDKAGSVLHPSHAPEKVWASLSEEAKGRLRMGLAASRWEVVVPFPLAIGEKNRVGRLRGYGNALCAPVAQTFIEAVMDELEMAL